MSTAELDAFVIEKGRHLRTFFDANPLGKDRFHDYLFILLLIFNPFPTESNGSTTL
jgi:hypothetical protein